MKGWSPWGKRQAVLGRLALDGGNRAGRWEVGCLRIERRAAIRDGAVEARVDRRIGVGHRSSGRPFERDIAARVETLDDGLAVAPDVVRVNAEHVEANRITCKGCRQL